MDLQNPRFVTRAEIFSSRPHREAGVRFTGLWLAGSLAGLARPTVAVVGSRAPSEAARCRARALGLELARAGVCVLSGLALGIDGNAHAGAVAGHGASLGILGGGHRRFFPRGNRELARSLLAGGGGVLSPYAPDEPARPPQFLQRNAVVAALADVVVVVEAAQRSGALNTAGWAAALGIDVLAYPGDVERPKAAGCNALIRDGATLVRGPEDVLAALGLGLTASPPLPDPARPVEAALTRLLAHGSRSLDAVIEELATPAGVVLAALVRLQIEGRIERHGNTLIAVDGYGQPESREAPTA